MIKSLKRQFGCQNEVKMRFTLPIYGRRNQVKITTDNKTLQYTVFQIHIAIF